MKSFKNFVYEHRKLIIGGTIGLVVAILMLTIGFFATLLLVALTALGAILAGAPGVLTKIGNGARELFRKIFTARK